MRSLWLARSGVVGLFVLGCGCQPTATSAPGSDGGSRDGGGLAAAPGRGWNSAGLIGPRFAAGSCTYGSSPAGFYLPDPRCSPGAVDPAVTQTNLSETICRRGGYTSSVRPPESMTETFKRQDEAAYRDPVPSGKTELDHLVPLGLGGASDTSNLWPEPDQGRPGQFDRGDSFGANAKDGVEDRLHTAVCDGLVGLARAQSAIASDWTTAETRLGISP